MARCVINAHHETEQEKTRSVWIFETSDYSLKSPSESKTNLDNNIDKISLQLECIGLMYPSA